MGSETLLRFPSRSYFVLFPTISICLTLVGTGLPFWFTRVFLPVCHLQHSPSDLCQSHFCDMLPMFWPHQPLCQYICCLAWIPACFNSYYIVLYLFAYPMPSYVHMFGSLVKLCVTSGFDMSLNLQVKFEVSWFRVYSGCPSYKYRSGLLRRTALSGPCRLHGPSRSGVPYVLQIILRTNKDINGLPFTITLLYLYMATC